MTEREGPYGNQGRATQPTTTPIEAAHAQARARMDDTRTRIEGSEAGRRWIDKLRALGIR